MIGSKQTKSLTHRSVWLCKRSVHETSHFIEIERTDHGLHRTDRAGRHRQRTHADGEQRQRLDRTARHLAADRQLDPGRPDLFHHKM